MKDKNEMEVYGVPGFAVVSNYKLSSGVRVECSLASDPTASIISGNKLFSGDLEKPITELPEYFRMNRFRFTIEEEHLGSFPTEKDSKELAEKRAEAIMKTVIYSQNEPFYTGKKNSINNLETEIMRERGRLVDSLSSNSFYSKVPSSMILGFTRALERGFSKEDKEALRPENLAKAQLIEALRRHMNLSVLDYTDENSVIPEEAFEKIYSPELYYYPSSPEIYQEIYKEAELEKYMLPHKNGYLLDALNAMRGDLSSSLHPDIFKTNQKGDYLPYAHLSFVGRVTMLRKTSLNLEEAEKAKRTYFRSLRKLAYAYLFSEDFKELLSREGIGPTGDKGLLLVAAVTEMILLARYYFIDDRLNEAHYDSIFIKPSGQPAKFGTAAAVFSELLDRDLKRIDGILDKFEKGKKLTEKEEYDFFDYARRTKLLPDNLF